MNLCSALLAVYRKYIVKGEGQGDVAPCLKQNVLPHPRARTPLHLFLVVISLFILWILCSYTFNPSILAFNSCFVALLLLYTALFLVRLPLQPTVTRFLHQLLKGRSGLILSYFVQSVFYIWTASFFVPSPQWRSFHWLYSLSRSRSTLL